MIASNTPMASLAGSSCVTEELATELDLQA